MWENAVFIGKDKGISRQEIGWELKHERTKRHPISVMNGAYMNASPSRVHYLDNVTTQREIAEQTAAITSKRSSA